MKAIILAAGRGSRMGDASEDKPKCLSAFCGKPLLEWQIEALTQAGAEEITIVTGYLSELLEPYSRSIIRNDCWPKTNMVMSLAAAHSILERHVCLISYSDIIYSKTAAASVVRTPGELVIAYDTEWEQLWSKRFSDPLSDAETFRIDKNGRVTDIGHKAKTIMEIEGQYMGLLKISPIGWSWVQELLNKLPENERNRLDMTSLLSQLIAEGNEVIGAAIPGGWYEVDSRSDLQLYETLGIPWQNV